MVNIRERNEASEFNYRNLNSEIQKESFDGFRDEIIRNNPQIKSINQRPAEPAPVPEVDNAKRLRDIGEKLKAQGYGDHIADFGDPAYATNLGVSIADLFLQHSAEEQRDEL